MEFHCQSNMGCLNLGSHKRYRSYLAQTKHEWEGRNEHSCGRGGRWEVGWWWRSPLPPPLAPQPGCPVQDPTQQQVLQLQGAPLFSAQWLEPVQIQPLIICFEGERKKNSTYEYIALQNTGQLRFCSSSYRQAASLTLSWKKSFTHMASWAFTELES